MQVEVRVEANYSGSERLILSGGERDPSQTEGYRLQWQPKSQHVFVIEGGIMACHVGLVTQMVTVGDHLVPVVGIGGVLTRPDCRGRGLGQLVMRTAQEFVVKHKIANFGLLFCRAAMQGWYERLGWSPITEPVWFDQPEGAIRSPLVVMLKCCGQERWPGGTVRLRCLPW
jgi:GNAT superfamily N-acetyltransferase